MRNEGLAHIPRGFFTEGIIQEAKIYDFYVNILALILGQPMLII